MSVYQASIQAFVQVIESQPHLLTIEHWTELEQIKSKLPADDNEEICEIIENWLNIESHDQLLQAYSQQLKLLISASDKEDITIGRDGSKSSASPNKPSEFAKELLENTIKKNSPLSNTQKPNLKL
ncbi:hypothetical protein FJR38_11830 [Anabaena sp. UHCC 0253]|uniref:hypothetical protein n=1 Tax=Anabaena sp. UHCC 0253 TaxID=2590019 RepID=UPI0014451542|nr:hypothetical protein [Anabaena sp. UHCC 0253]MTJ53286.1 hypothetical protein [Anabaena sp. UHCC 0253]